jgi:hypothetical protein
MELLTTTRTQIANGTQNSAKLMGCKRKDCTLSLLQPFRIATFLTELRNRDGRIKTKRFRRNGDSKLIVIARFSREKYPLPIYENHPNWIGGQRRVALKTGDYSVDGMEAVLSLERKSLADLVACTVSRRGRFIAACSRMAQFRWKAILVEATLEDVKGGFEMFDIPSEVHPNAVCGTLDAIEAKFGIPVIYASSVRELAAERAASWLSKHFTYWWLEKEGYGRVLIDSDRL